MTEALLRVEELSAGYGAVPVLYNVQLRVGRGEIVALVGSNGAGKTTLLRAVSRVIEAHGILEFESANILPLAPEAVFTRGLVQVPEGRQLFANMSVEDNLRMGAFRRKDKAGVAESFERVYQLFPRLKERRRQMAGNMSGGEQQMCAMGRALMAAPKLLMIDEMSLGLAPVVVDHLLEVLTEIRSQNVAVLLVEQDVFAAFTVADRGYVMETGKIVRHGPIAELQNDPAIREAYLGA